MLFILAYSCYLIVSARLDCVFVESCRVIVML